jgi:hypothetical protein
MCSLCIQKEEKREKRKSRSSTEGQLFVAGDSGPPSGERPRPSSSSLHQAPPEGMTPMKATLFGIMGVLLVGFAAAAVYVLVLDKGAEQPPPPPPAKIEPPSEKKAEEVKVEEPEPEPEKPEIPRSYEPRWFVGEFRGTSPDEGEGLGALVFEEGDEKVLVQAPAALQGYYTRGKTYRFKFKPTDKFYEHGVISYYNLQSGIAEKK